MPQTPETLKVFLEEYTEVIATREELNALPAGSIILTEITEYDFGGKPIWMRKTSSIGGCDLTPECQCGGWMTFGLWKGGIEDSDDYLPELPSLLVLRGDEEEDD